MSLVSYFPAIDRVSGKSDHLKDIPAARLAVCVLLVTICGDGGKAALYHCEIERQRRTFISGKWPRLGLGKSLSSYFMIRICIGSPFSCVTPGRIRLINTIFLTPQVLVIQMILIDKFLPRRCKHSREANATVVFDVLFDLSLTRKWTGVKNYPFTTHSS